MKGTRSTLLLAGLAFCGACVHGKAELEHTSPLDEARAEMKEGKNPEAYALLCSLHGERPEDLDVARLYAEAAFRTGHAQELARKVAAQNSKSESAVSHYLLGLLAFAQQADVKGAAESELKRAIELLPRSAELRYRLGVAYLESEAYSQAVELLTSASGIDSSKPSIQLRLAQALSRVGERSKAVEAIRIMLADQPDAEEVKAARDVMERVADPYEGVPKAADERLAKGLEWLKTADIPQEAIVTFEGLLHDYPDLGVVHALLGLAYERIDDAGRAIDEIKRAIELQPTIGKNFLYLGQIYLARQRADVARESFQRATERDPLIDEAYERLGDMALNGQDYAAAERAFRVLVVLRSSDVKSRAKLAVALELEGDLQDAEHELKRAMEQSPESVDLMLHLGLLYVDERTHAAGPQARKTATNQASHWLKQVLRVQPENALATRALEALK